MDEPDAQGTTDASHPKFRTYASDVAALTGSHTPLPKDARNAPASATPTPISMPPKDAAPASAPVPPPAPEPVAPPAPVVPYDPPPADIIPKAPNTEESRESILARLRAKAADHIDPVAPPPASIIPKAPTTDEAREQVLARLRGGAASAAPQAPAPAPIASAPRPAPLPSIPPVTKPVPAAAPIHTYKSDFSDKAKETGASKISILAAEQNALGRAAPVALKTPKKSYTLLIAGAVLLILAGGASIYFAFAFVTGHPPVIVAPSVPSLIFADERVELHGTSAELRSGLAELSNHPLSDGGVAVAYVTYSTTTEKGKTITLPAAGGALISAMGLPAPQILLRNIDPASTVGVVHAGSETRPFFIFRVGSFERTFAGMLDWESTMGRDLALFYPAYPEVAVEPLPFETTAATSTTNVASMPFSAFSLSFADDIVDNQDVRVLRDASGRSLLLYGYRDKETLIVARDEAAFSELLKRLASTRAQ